MTASVLWLVLIGGGLAAAAVGNASGAAAAVAMVDEDRAGRWVRQDAVTLRHAAEALVAVKLSRPYERIEARVPDYAEWVYGWISSLVISARLAGVGVQTAGSQLWQGQSLDTEEIGRDLEAYVAQAFEERVIRPEAAEHALFEGWQEAVDRLALLDRRLAAARASRGAPAAFAQPLLTDWYPSAPDRLMRGPGTALPDTAGGPAQAEVVLTRSVRPLSIRVLSAATRLVIVPFVIPTIGSAAGATMVDTGGLLGASLFSGAIAAGLWGADYLLNWLDSARNRPVLEADLREVIRTQRDLTVAEAKLRMGAALCQVRTVAPVC